jgi:two-component system sensor histidine kinase YesM
MIAFVRKLFTTIWNYFFNLSLKHKMVVLFIFLITIPMTVASYISYQSYSRSIAENASAYVTEISSKVLVRLDDNIADLKRITALPLYISDLQKAVQDPGNNSDKLRTIYNYISSLNQIKPDTTSVYIWDSFGNFYDNFRTDGVRQNVAQQYPGWLKAATDAEGLPVLMSTQDLSPDPQVPSFVFSVVRELRDMNSLGPIGLIVLDTKMTLLEKTINELDQVTKGKTIILDNQNKVIYDSEKLFMNQDLSQESYLTPAVGTSGNFTATMNGTAYLCNYTTSEVTGWKVLVYVPKSELTQKATITRNATMVATLLISAIAYMISLVIIIALTKPLTKMTLLMKQAQKGNFDVRFPVKYQDEVGILGRHFNQMVIRIKELIDEITWSQRRKNEAEIRALQSQINPHFIYNTLETIRMMAELSDDERVANMTFTLGQLLRYSILRGEEVVTIRQELEHLEHYLYLQNMRFRDKFQLKLQIPEAEFEFPMPKLIVQPIVENAIYHGLEQSEDHGEITISMRREGMYLLFIVADNGGGMDALTAEQLNEQFRRELDWGPGDRHGIGLRNVNERIKLHYGEEFGLRITSEFGVGTQVTIRLPGHLSVQEG